MTICKMRMNNNTPKPYVFITFLILCLLYFWGHENLTLSKLNDALAKEKNQVEDGIKQVNTCKESLEEVQLREGNSVNQLSVCRVSLKESKLEEETSMRENIDYAEKVEKLEKEKQAMGEEIASLKQTLESMINKTEETR